MDGARMRQEECMNPMIALALALAALTTTGTAPSEHEPTRWHVEVRDVKTDRASMTMDPKSGRLVASFDVDQNAGPVWNGDGIPYVDPQSIVFPSPSKEGAGSARTLTLHTGLEVSIDGTDEAPVLHAKDVDLIDFTQHMVMDTYVTLPRTIEMKLDTPIRAESVGKIVGGYTKGDSRHRRMRFFVVSRS